MSAGEVRLAGGDGAELVEMLEFIREWLGGADRDMLAASFARFVGTDAYGLAELRTALARFVFLLGGDDGEQLFGHQDR